MEIIKLSATNSTNEYLKKFIVNNSLTTKHVVYTFNQTNGKGQRGKIWHSEPGKNLAFSICIFPKNIEVKNQFIINMIVSLFLINILKALKIPDLKIKWPNDIMSGGKKICGILNETKLKGNKIENVIIGFGLNVNQETFENLPNASSLKLINKINYDLDGLVSYIIQCLKNYDYLDVKTELEFNKIAKNYNNNLYGLDSFYNFKDSNNKIFLGKILSVAENGNLKIMKKNSKIKSYNFQEIQMILSN